MKEITLDQHKKLISDIETLLMLNYGASMHGLNLRITTLAEAVQKQAIDELKEAVLKVYKVSNKDFMSKVKSNNLLYPRATFSHIAWLYLGCNKQDLQRFFKRKSQCGSFGSVQTRNHEQFFMLFAEYRENYAKILELINLKIPTKC
jgi:hypothetical protein